MSQIAVQGEEALKNKIVIQPELAIGTEIWIMYDNYPRLGLISGYQVWVTASDSKDGRGLYEQMFGRFAFRKKQKEYFEYSYAFQCKIEGLIHNFFPTKKGDRFYVLDKPIYFSKEDLLASL